ncbi:hypothetical protein [Actinosynnema mirum]|uniref:Uncharacterized protein n=1 Tax=Actinosynnema mirum (strain ATCC 29888 / DSM 43827 / JCM 3225 / NBRC 14064 / NCIMB 13271 / NRRL B-12336 / IMRU 3971 / 101) TaxID=446462 RepID=C6WGW0_ACTMD|nr:hypothetical protein [Actinosynnema mirum]ACU36028.1 hypothetical protein Amir_2082 [Actinosynnema mirum DSM 43827]
MSVLLNPDHHRFVVLDDHGSEDLVGLVDQLRAWNSRHGQALPCLWQVVVEQIDVPDVGAAPATWLDVGTAGDVGALRWVGATEAFVPRERGGEPLRAGWMPYASDHMGYPCRVHRSLLAPLPVVWSALADLVRTRARPELPAPWRWEPVEDWSALVREPA